MAKSIPAVSRPVFVFWSEGRAPCCHGVLRPMREHWRNCCLLFAAPAPGQLPGAAQVSNKAVKRNLAQRHHHAQLR